MQRPRVPALVRSCGSQRRYPGPFSGDVGDRGRVVRTARESVSGNAGYARLLTMHLLCSCCMRGTGLGSGDMLSQRGQFLCPLSQWEEPQK